MSLSIFCFFSPISKRNDKWNIQNNVFRVLTQLFILIQLCKPIQNTTPWWSNQPHSWFDICHLGSELKTFRHLTEMTEHMHTEMDQLQWPQWLVILEMLNSVTQRSSSQNFVMKIQGVTICDFSCYFILRHWLTLKINWNSTVNLLF